ncbi:MAG: sirohydrochlorin chelatase [Cyanobacteriota bacterium]|nr:sirohydrochlorin chelatase [Cyanobacteriota bacterium]
MTNAYLLISHGSRDPRPQVAAEELARKVAQSLTTVGQNSPMTPAVPMVETAALEFAPLELYDAIAQFASKAKAKGLTNVQIVPLFLHKGVHVLEDVPAEVNRARSILGDAIALQLCPYLGSSPDILALLAAQFERLPGRDRILLAHGTRREGGNQPVEAIARQLQAHPAYWSVTPSLAQSVAAATERGATEIAIVPYFLFAGGITEAIARQVEDLQTQYHSTLLHLGQPLGPTPKLAQLVAKSLNGMRKGDS